MTNTLAIRASAVLFAVMYGVAMFLPSLPEGAYSDGQVLATVNDDATPVVLAGYALALAGLAALWWTGLVASRLHDERSALPRLVAIGGTGYGILLMVASTFFSTIAFGHAIGELPATDDAFLVRAVSNQGFHLLLVPGLLCAGLVVLAVSILGRRSRLLPTWCWVTGFCVAPMLLLGVAWMPQFLVPLWALLVAFSIRDRGPAQSPTFEMSRSAAA